MAFILAMIIQPIVMIWYGFVLTKLWSWFIVTTFSLPELGMPTAIGVALVIGFLTHQSQKTEEDPIEGVVRVGIHGLINPALYLLMGYIVSMFL